MREIILLLSAVIIITTKFPRLRLTLIRRTRVVTLVASACSERSSTYDLGGLYVQDVCASNSRIVCV
ncbi:MAG: hypothetical protein WKF71_20685 [Pyrinomonadaceae bacterium]